MIDERWLPVPDYPNYEVSDQGRVRSRPRSRTRGGLLKAPPNPAGYPEVHLYSDEHRRTWRVHVLVARAFLGPCPPGLEVRHLDDDKANPTLSNLAYGTRSENVLDRVRLGAHNMASKRHCVRGHSLTDPENLYIIPTTGSRQCRACVRQTYHEKRAIA